jgi:UDP-N-acetylglucosamine 2-epimerase (non-hydrolysing)/GDP/UDP-N,N'-diacetylbacillosamine 2-epimerase (hydrolysing)
MAGATFALGISDSVPDGPVIGCNQQLHLDAPSDQVPGISCESYSKGRQSGWLGSLKRKVAIVTSSRADYAHVRWLLHDLARHPAVELQVIALGPHLSPAFGHTAKQISGKVTTIECLLDSDTDVGMAKTIGVATLGLADALDRLRPDILLLIADRYEMLAPASVALALRIPIAHVEGGEITAGAIDDAVRNGLTKMSHLHFACTRKAAERIAAMGEERWRIRFSGSLSLDHLRRECLLTKAQVEKTLRLKLGRGTVLCIYHPVTLLKDTVEEAEEMFAALSGIEGQVIFIYPNADAGSRELIRRAEKFAAAHTSSRVLVNLDHRTYLSLLSHAGVLVGNSSSGIIESTSLEVPAVNVGIRQTGREHAANVIDVPAQRKAIRAAISRALSTDFRCSIRGLEGPYGDGGASKIIADTLAKAPLGARLLFKHAYSI